MAGFDADPRLRIGLTGGVAAGKSLVADAFARRGVAVLDADAAARAVTAPGTPVLAALVARHGATLAADGTLDRRALRERLFADPALRTAVESLLHPAILDRLAADGARAAGPYLVYAVPLLAERGLAGLFHRVLVVDCDEALQLARLTARDGIDEAAARRMLAAQAGRPARRALANDLIVNDAGPDAIEPQVERLHREYLALSARHPFPPPGGEGQNSRP